MEDKVESVKANLARRSSALDISAEMSSPRYEGELRGTKRKFDNDEIFETWKRHLKKAVKRKYMILAAPEMEAMAKTIQATYPDRFMYHVSNWGKFPDGTDCIDLGGFHPANLISGEDVILLCSFHNNDVTLSQFSAMIALLQSFITSLVVVLPFYPVGTMERVVKEGQIATANTYAQLFSNLPSCGHPTRVIVYDLHTLQNRFYLHGNAIASLQTTIPILKAALERNPSINCIAFPDDGAAKRFSYMFDDLGYEVVTCGKVRSGDARKVTIQDGSPSGKNVIIIDDLVQTGGTLYECGVALRTAGASCVNAFVAHAVFPNMSWRRFLRNGDRFCFDKFFVTNSVPTVVRNLPVDDVFEVLDISLKIVEDIDSFTKEF